MHPPRFGWHALVSQTNGPDDADVVFVMMHALQVAALCCQAVQFACVADALSHAATNAPISADEHACVPTSVLARCTGAKAST